MPERSRAGAEPAPDLSKRERKVPDAGGYEAPVPVTLPELWGVDEVNKHFSPLTRTSVWRYMNREDFPRPAVELSCGKIWIADQVRAWSPKRRQSAEQRPRA